MKRKLKLKLKDKSYFVKYISDLPELEKVVVMPFVREADEIDLSEIPNW